VRSKLRMLTFPWSPSQHCFGSWTLERCAWMSSQCFLFHNGSVDRPKASTLPHTTAIEASALSLICFG
jgi:hypothetical protein